MQLIDATNIYTKLRKPLGNKKNEFSPENRAEITKLYTDFSENDLSQIHANNEFIYREYTVKQPLQRDYGITEARIQQMLQSTSVKNFYDEAKVQELESSETKLKAKDAKKLAKYKKNEATYKQMMSILKDNISDKLWMSPEEFEPVLHNLLDGIVDKKLISKIMDGLSQMDKKAEIQHDRKGNIVYDKETADTEIVNIDENIDDYMKKEVLPFVPDAKAFFEEDLGKKKPIIKTGAEIPFTRFFYKYQKPEDSNKLAVEINKLEASISEDINELFKTEN